jgi:hypothetical protein
LAQKISSWNVGLVMLVGIFLAQVPQQASFANHGEEIEIKFSDAQYLVLPNKNADQVKFTTTYSVSDSDTVGRQINGIMQISTNNGTLIKTTSIPNGFKADKTGFQQFVTSLPATSPKTITATVLFTDLNKTSALSNSIIKDLALNKSQ